MYFEGSWFSHKHCGVPYVGCECLHWLLVFSFGGGVVFCCGCILWMCSGFCVGGGMGMVLHSMVFGGMVKMMCISSCLTSSLCSLWLHMMIVMVSLSSLVAILDQRIAFTMEFWYGKCARPRPIHFDEFASLDDSKMNSMLCIELSV